MDTSSPTRHQAAPDRERSFLANAAHELRTPLHSANGFVEMVLDEVAGPLSERQNEMLAYAHTAIGQLAILIEDVLFLARADSGEIQTHLTTVDPLAILTRVLDTVREHVTAQGVLLTQRLAEIPASIQADGERLREGLSGLLRGCLAMMLSDGVMAVSATAHENTLTFAVTLENVRISAVDRRHLFERFYQPRPLGSDRSAHLGLGLVIAQTTAQWHGGNVRATTSLDGNLILSYELPIIRS